ncbi:DUF885 domain-containing protein [Roseomonas sp. OT10]|uniref:DUF885 family protein n=1 Tax=Roseomonas cutis TaxID=2897332 RepID=UPI001E51ADE3|nr:DUF885 family protein [Roseomonas sp. OT10]UFN47234.1 DUF885 domain-containing protein [Roseomonas sp. OT10]
MGIGQDFLDHHLRFRPVDATFMGAAGHDDRLPPAGAGTVAEERRGLEALAGRLATLPGTADPGERMDRRMAAAAIRLALAELERRPRLHNPAWYTGEAGFGVIALLLPESAGPPEAVTARLEAIPDFLGDGLARLQGLPLPGGWVTRARREAAALAALMTERLPRHPAWQEAWEAPAARAAAAFARFGDALEGRPDADPACGDAHLDLILRAVHGLPFGTAEAIRDAEAAFAEVTAELEAQAARRNPGCGWREQIAGGTVATDPPSAYQVWHERAMRAAAGLVTPASEYGLTFRPIPAAFRLAAPSLYFLSYRSPPAFRPGRGSIYWTAEGQTLPAIRSTHAVHHGSLGHHTQNARARAAPGVLARVAGTDAAMGLTLLGAGTMVEGWACHAQDLMREMPGFLPPGEELLQLAAERRNIAFVLVDLRLHRGEWSEAEAVRFYTEEAGFPTARAPAEVVRNTIFPGSRAMYWLGTREIRAMRRRSPLAARDFHDRLLAQGHVPVRWAHEALVAAGT